MRRSKLICAASISLYATAFGATTPKTQANVICPVLAVGSWPLPTTCPVDIPGIIEDDAGSAQDGQWFRSDNCHQIGSDEFCAFTQPSFNAGHGIALVTTAQIIQEMVSLPIFTDIKSQNFVSTQSASPPYRDEQIPGKGIGLVATRPLRSNEGFLRRTPIVMVDDTAFKRLGRARLTDLLTQAIGDLPETHQKEYLNLTTHTEVETLHEKVYEIFMKNDFVTPVEGIVDFHSVFPQGQYFLRLTAYVKFKRPMCLFDAYSHICVVSRLNHACRPNSKYSFDASTLSQSVFAARKVETGEELTVTYFE